METITLKGRKVVENDFQIPMPYFSKHKDIDLYYKVIDSEKAIYVSDFSLTGSRRISICDAADAVNDENTTITEGEFLQAYERVRRYMDDLVRPEENRPKLPDPMETLMGHFKPDAE